MREVGSLSAWVNDAWVPDDALLRQGPECIPASAPEQQVSPMSECDAFVVGHTCDDADMYLEGTDSAAMTYKGGYDAGYAAVRSPFIFVHKGSPAQDRFAEKIVLDAVVTRKGFQLLLSSGFVVTHLYVNGISQASLENESLGFGLAIALTGLTNAVYACSTGQGMG